MRNMPKLGSLTHEPNYALLSPTLSNNAQSNWNIILGEWNGKKNTNQSQNNTAGVSYGKSKNMTIILSSFM